MSRWSIALSLVPLLSIHASYQVVVGEAEWSSVGEGMKEIIATDRAVLEWDDFSIESGQGLRFLLPSSGAAVVNQVIGIHPSQILGLLESNGKVILVNPNGIFFGKEAKVDTGSLIASTLDLNRELFLKDGTLAFEESVKGSIRNEGTLIAREGEACLIGQTVENAGRIDGFSIAGLVAADQVLLKPEGVERIYVRTAASRAGADAFGSAFQPVDEYRVGSGGEVVSSGGKIFVLGEAIEIRDRALLDASAPFGGGEIFIGGEYQGAGRDFVSAKRTWIAPNAQIAASALERGDGGKVILWGDEANWFNGIVRAEGGPQGGDGGFVEVSSPYFLDFQGTVSTAAPLGQTGSLLLDPINLTIGGATNAQTTTTPAGPMFTLAVPNAVGATLGAAALVTALGSNNVTVSTVGSVGAQGGDITVSNAVSWLTANALTLNAAQDIIVNANIQQDAAATCPPTGGATPPIKVSLNAARDIVINGTPTSVGSRNDGTLINAGRDITLRGGTLNTQSVQIGFFTPAGGSSAGAIQVIAGRNISLLESATGATFAGTRIGHGQPNNSGAAGVNVSTPASGTATIQVVAGGNLVMRGGIKVAGMGSGQPSPAVIGHGAQRLDSPGDQYGDITVFANNITMDTFEGGSPANIGHGSIQRPNNVADLGTFAGNIGVFASGNLTMTKNPSPTQGTTSSHVHIGHNSDETAIGAQLAVTNILGNIEVAVGGNLTLTEGTITAGFTGGSIMIGPNAAFVRNIGAPGAPVVERVSVAGNLNVTKLNQAVEFFIGIDPTLTAGKKPLAYLTLYLEVQGDINFNTAAGSVGPFEIGGGNELAASQIDVFGVVAGNMNILSGSQSAFTLIAQRPNPGVAGGDINFAVQGNATIAGPALGTNILGAATLAEAGDVRLFVGGDLLMTNPAATNFFLFSNSLDVRAGGSIAQLANDMTVAAGNRLSLQAAHAFAQGELFTVSAGPIFSFATICGQATNITGSFSPNCTSFPCVCVSCIGGSGPTANFNCVSPGSPCAAGQCLYNNFPLGRSPSPAVGGACGTIQVLPTANIDLVGPPNPLVLSGSCTTCGNVPFQVPFGFGAVLPNVVNIVGVPGSIAVSSLFNIDLNQAITSTGAISISACNNLNQNSGLAVTSTGAGSPISLVADVDNSGSGNLTLTGNVTTTAAGAITLGAGPGTNAGTSSINQTGGIIQSNGGSVTAQAALNVTFSGASPTVINTLGGTLGVTANSGTISIDENILTTTGAVGGSATFTAGLDILVNPPGGGSVAGGSVATQTGNIAMSAKNNVTINGDPTSLSTTTGNINVTADSDNSGVGTLLVQKNITSSLGGNICLASGPGTFGCSSNNCHSGLISGFPVGSCLVNIAAGTVSSTTGMINVVSAEDIIVNGASPSISTAGPITLTAGLGDLTVLQQVVSSASSITTFAGNDTTLTQTGVLPLIHAAQEIRMITGLNMTLNPNTAILSNGPGNQVTLVVDNIHPILSQPPFPSSVSGKFTMLAGSSVTSGSPLRIFTAYSQIFGSGAGINFIDPTARLNGQLASAPGNPFGYPTAPFNDTPYEQWCVVFGCPSNYPFPDLGVPFTVFYKICLVQLTTQAQTVVTEFLLDLHPYNEFPGWKEEFSIAYQQGASYSSLSVQPKENYLLRRRHLNILNQPKSWTQLIPE